MKKIRIAKRILATVLSLIMVIGLLPMTAFATPGDYGNTTNLFDGTTYKLTSGTDAEIWLYTTPFPTGIDIVCNKNEDDTKVFTVKYDKNKWEFVGWYTWFRNKIGTVDKANPNFDIGSDWYFSKMGDADTKYNGTDESIQVNKERVFGGVFYLHAIFKPVFKVEIDTSFADSAEDLPHFSLELRHIEEYNIAEKVTTASYACAYGKGAYYLYPRFHGLYDQLKICYLANGTDVTQQVQQTGKITAMFKDITEPTNVKITLYLPKIEVAYSANGGTGSMQNQRFTFNKEQALSANTFTKTGYLFTGWNTAANGSGTDYSDKQEVTFVFTDDTTVSLYAQWEKCTNHNWENGVCTKCEEGCSHTGGTATCTEQATCTQCGLKYGSLLQHKLIYSVKGNVISESCENNCGHSAAATLMQDNTIDTGYTGNAIEALKVDYSDNWQGGQLDIAYFDNIDPGTASGSISIGGVTVTVEYQIEATYTVVFDSNTPDITNNEMLGTMEPKLLKYSEEYTLPQSSFQLDCYEFVCWNTKADGTGQTYVVGDKISKLAESGTVTLYAQWEPNKYEVTFSYGGESYKQKMVYDKYEALTAFEETGFSVPENKKFAGWKRNNGSFGGTIYGDGASVVNLCNVHNISGEITGYKLEPYFIDANQPAVMITKDGETYTSFTVSLKLEQNGSTQTISMKNENGVYVPESNGQIPEGTYDIVVNGTDTQRDIMIGSGENNYAHLQYYSVDVICDEKLENAQVLPFGQVLQGAEVDITVNNKPDSGYIFDKWNTIIGTPTYVKSDEYASETKIIINDKTKLKAVARPINYEIVFNANKPDGAENDISGKMEAQCFTYDKESALKMNGYALKGYLFTGWNTEANGSGASYADESRIKNLTTTDKERITLYAQWEKCKKHKGDATCVKASICTECGQEYILEHQYVYSGEDNVITETCVNSCSHSETATLEQDNNASAVYTGSAIEALKVSYSTDWQGGELKIAYTDNINAGTAIGSIFIKNAAVSAKFIINKADPAIGTVGVDGVVKDTTKPSEVVLTRTDDTVDGELKLDMTDDDAMLANKTAYNWVFTPTDINNYNVIKGVVQIDVLDTVAPTGVIKVNNNEWKQFINNITFGLFFKSMQEVTITAADNDNGSGIKDVFYFVSDKEISETDLTAVEWKAYNRTFSIEPNGKYVIYAKIIDNDGNTTTISSDGIVLYTDAKAVTDDIDVSYKAGKDKKVAVNLNGNAIKAIANGTKALAEGTDYSVSSGDEIILKAEYLDTLAPGSYIFTVSYDPLGENYVEGADNVAPAVTSFTAKVTRDITKANVIVNDTLTYDGNAKTPEPIVVLNGEILEKDKDYLLTYSNNINAGKATVTVTGKGNFVGAVSELFTIGKVHLTVTADDKSKTYGEADPELTWSITKGALVKDEQLTDINLYRASGEDAHKYWLFVRQAEGANKNYDITFQHGTFTINPKKVEADVIVEGGPFFYNEGEQKPEVIVKDGNTVIPVMEYDVSYANNINEGTATVIITDKDGGNYIVNGDAKFIINKADPAIGTVGVDGVVKDTTKPSEVVLTRTDDTVDGELKLDMTDDDAMLANKTAYNWVFTPTDINNYNVIKGAVQIDVLDTVAPTGVIKVNNNEWKQFINNITFGLFFKSMQEVTITAADNDNGSGIKDVFYFVSDKEISETDLTAVEWKAYNRTFSIEPNGKYVIYAKIIDNDGNIAIINSDGLVLDATTAAINGITDGETYFGDVSFTVADDLTGVKDVSIDGTPAAEGNYIIAADNAQHTIIVTDNAGNVTEYKITVYKNYIVTYMADGQLVSTEIVGYGKDATLPDVPAKEGYVGKWDNDGRNITCDTVINVIYTELPVVDADNPQTGDSSNLWLWCTLLFISSFGILGIRPHSRKRKVVNDR